MLSLQYKYIEFKINISDNTNSDNYKDIRTNSLIHTLKSLYNDFENNMIEYNNNYFIISVDESRYRKVDILKTIFTYYHIEDLKINDISTEAIIKRIYEEGLK